MLQPGIEGPFLGRGDGRKQVGGGGEAEGPDIPVEVSRRHLAESRGRAQHLDAETWEPLIQRVGGPSKECA